MSNSNSCSCDFPITEICIPTDKLLNTESPQDYLDALISSRGYSIERIPCTFTAYAGPSDNTNKMKGYYSDNYGRNLAHNVAARRTDARPVLKGTGFGGWRPSRKPIRRQGRHRLAHPGC